MSRLPCTALALIALSGSHTALADCGLSVEVGDGLAYSTTSLATEASCETAKVTITHTGKLPAAAMGHNWVLARPDDFDAVTKAAIQAGLDANYVPDDERVLASSKIVGGGESDTVDVPVSTLGAGEYVFFCTFPGHWTVMKGTFTVS